MESRGPGRRHIVEQERIATRQEDQRKKDESCPASFERNRDPREHGSSSYPRHDYQYGRDKADRAEQVDPPLVQSLLTAGYAF